MRRPICSRQVFDFTDMENAAAGSFQRSGGSLAPASACTRTIRPRAIASPSSSRIRSALQKLSDAVESAYQWKSDRGLVIAKVAIVSIEYDANTRDCSDGAARRCLGRFAWQFQPAGERGRRHAGGRRNGGSAVSSAGMAGACSCIGSCSNRGASRRRCRRSDRQLKKAKECLISA